MDNSLEAKALEKIFFSLKTQGLVKTQGDFGKRIGVGQQYVSIMLKGKVRVSKNTIKKIKEEFDINFYDYLATPNTKFTDEAVQSSLGQFVEVQLVRTPAEAGILFLEQQQQRDKLEKEVVLRSMLKGAHPSEVVTFEINGDSMANRIKHGDKVVCKKMDHGKSLKKYLNRCFIIVTDGNCLCKRLHKINENSQSMVLTSDNEYFEDIRMDFAEIKGMFLVLSFLGLADI